MPWVSSISAGQEVSGGGRPVTETAVFAGLEGAPASVLRMLGTRGWKEKSQGWSGCRVGGSDPQADSSANRAENCEQEFEADRGGGAKGKRKQEVRGREAEGGTEGIYPCLRVGSSSPASALPGTRGAAGSPLPGLWPAARPRPRTRGSQAARAFPGAPRTGRATTPGGPSPLSPRPEGPG